MMMMMMLFNRTCTSCILGLVCKWMPVNICVCFCFVFQERALLVCEHIFILILVSACNCCQRRTTILTEADVAFVFNLSVYNSLKAPHTAHPAGVTLQVSDRTSDSDWCVCFFISSTFPFHVLCVCVIAELPPHACAWLTDVVISVWHRGPALL